MNVLGIHHVTAISSNIAENLEFYTGVMGLRLVKKSINQDDVTAYHLFYADAVGSPGTDVTFFDWPNIPRTEPGAGTITNISLRIPRSSFSFWEERLREAAALMEIEEDRILAVDPEGLRLVLVADDGMPSAVKPWDKTVPAEYATRGILGVDLESLRYEGTCAVLTSLLGFSEIAPGRFELQTEDAMARVNVVRSEARHFGHPGSGGIHHVAFRVPDDEHLHGFRERIEAAGLHTSGFVDRYYFHSLYFREPGGVLFELATDGPGMHVDEDIEHLGEHLSIPPFMADRRARIEAGLRPLPDPAYLQVSS